MLFIWTFLLVFGGEFFVFYFFFLKMSSFSKIFEIAGRRPLFAFWTTDSVQLKKNLKRLRVILVKGIVITFNIDFNREAYMFYYKNCFLYSLESEILGFRSGYSPNEYIFFKMFSFDRLQHLQLLY